MAMRPRWQENNHAAMFVLERKGTSCLVVLCHHTANDHGRMVILLSCVHYVGEVTSERYTSQIRNSEHMGTFRKVPHL